MKKVKITIKDGKLHYEAEGFEGQSCELSPTLSALEAKLNIQEKTHKQEEKDENILKN